MCFSDRLKKMRIQKGLTQKQLANELDIAERQMQRYEYGASEPTKIVLIKMADYFNVSIDYLVGRTDKKEVNK